MKAGLLAYWFIELNFVGKIGLLLFTVWHVYNVKFATFRHCRVSFMIKSFLAWSIIQGNGNPKSIKTKKFQWYFTLTFYGLNRQRMHSFNGLFFIHVIECKKKEFFGTLKIYSKSLKWLITDTFSKPETNHFCY